jgi:putative ABC transport system permease protein
MKPLKVINIAWQALLKNKIRSLLTMLGIIIGVAAVIIMIAISAGTEAAIQEQITGLGSNLIYVSGSMSRMGPGSNQTDGGLVYDDAFAISDQVIGVKGVVVEQNSSQIVKAGDITLDGVTIMGTTADFPSVRDMEITTGRYFSQVETDRTTPIAVLGSSLAEELFGDRDPFGETITVAGNIRLTVVGVFEEKGMIGDVDYDSRLYTPITIVLEKLTSNEFARFKGNRVRTIYVEVDEGLLAFL